MLRDLILNFAILSVYLFFASPFFIRDERDPQPTWKYKLTAGAVFGLLGVMLLFFSITTTNNTPLNMRGIALMLASYFGGPIGAIAELIVVYIGRYLKEGSLNLVQMAIGFSAAFGTGYLFTRIKSYGVKWIVGSLFLLNYYYFVLWLAGQITLETVWAYIVSQACYSFLIAGFLYYLVHNHHNRNRITQVEQDMIGMLRMQPGLTFRFQPKHGTYYYNLAEGQLLKKIGLLPSMLHNKSFAETELFKDDFIDFLDQNHTKFSNDETVSYETMMAGIAVHITLQPVIQNGQLTDIIGNAIDITDLQKRKEADAASRAKSQFLAQMSHEIRTPINAIVGLNYILQQSRLDEQQRGYIDKIITAAKSLLTIVNDILDFSKIEAGKIVLEKVEFDLYEVLYNVSSMMSFKANEKGLRFHFFVHPDVPQMLVGDPFRVLQIVLNLANNAIKFTSQGQITISVNRILQRDQTSVLSFNIRDTGIGMNEEQLGSLFKEFTQADMTTTRKFGGTGLGLIISKNLAELMGGKIDVESKVGSGSSFTFKAPFTVAAIPAVAAQEISPQLTFLRVLIICDDSQMQRVLCSQLEQFQFVVSTAQSAEDALQNISRGGIYDLILLDWRLSGTDVLRLADTIHAMFTSPSQSIILISAYHEAELQMASQSAAIAKTLLHPISQSQLYNEIITLFQPHFASKRSTTDYSIQFASLQDAVVLLVEDNEINQLVARELLREVGIGVDVANNGEIAVQYAAERRYDAILMDLQMPVMDGYEATKAIRQSVAGRAEVPIIAMTADAMKGVENEVLSVGMNGYLTKPFDPIDLYSMLQRHMQRTREQETAAGAAEAAAAKAAPHLDQAAAIGRLSGNTALYRQIIGLFANKHAIGLREAREAIAAGDVKNAVLHVHTLKGVASNIGADRLADLMAKLQAALQADDHEAASALLLDGEQELQAVLLEASWIE
ncbi:signal transduction histidine kinase [Paenibacillus taihuensis]|uniref:Circadian input-output histidine kinase CikA n=1 Tax=Paenibacillus taihuensis TaxID=1156355 RepID=A0A3D9SNP9_9BACL|nr:response regulator [Paenibacillus taihuensis]REE91316.1 signal transduction histidine kinase [Paenibacillus taihuensis]